MTNFSQDASGAVHAADQRTQDAALNRLTMAEGRHLVANGELDPRDWVGALMRCIRATDSRIGAVVELLEDQVLAEARGAAELAAARAKPAQGAVQSGQGDEGSQDLPPLLGVPVALKELIAVAGAEHRAGTPFRSGVIAETDAWLTRQLRVAGAIVLATTATHEWALGTTTQNPHFGPTRNPWDLDRIPGGSSGGNGAGLAARMFPGAVGTDTGGSVRIPAALCGVVGLKPTHGRVSLDGVVPLAWSLDHAGPMARTAEDVGLLLGALTGFDPADPVSRAPAAAGGGSSRLRPADPTPPGGMPRGRKASSVQPVPSASQATRPLEGLRVAVLDDWFWRATDSEVAAPCHQAIDRLADLGADVRRLTLWGLEGVPTGRGPAAQTHRPPPDWPTWTRASGVILLAEAAAYHADRLAAAPDRFGEDVRRRLEAGAALSGPEVASAYRLRSVARREIAGLFEEIDVLVGPTTESAAMSIEGVDGVEAAKRLTSLTAPFNFTGVPALSVPCGFTASGLPVGLQLIAGHWRDELLVQVGVAYQSVTDWHLREPPCL